MSLYYEESFLRFRIRDYLKGLTALLIVLWLFKGWLRLEAYNEYMVWAIIALIVIIELLGVGRWFGVTVSGVIFALAKAAFLIAVFLFFGKWLGLPEGFPITAGTAFAYAVVLAIAALLVAKFDKGEIKAKVESKAYEFTGAHFGNVELVGRGKAYPVKFGRRMVGWVIDGSVEVVAETPLGTVRKKLIPPIAVWTSLSIVGKKTSPDPAFVEMANRLMHHDRLYKKNKADTVVDLGFLKVYEGEDFEYVKLPFLEVIETPSGEEVRIGPIRIREGHPERPPSEMLTIRELTNGFQLTKIGDRLRIQTEDYSIEVSGERVTYRSGGESLSLGKDHVSLKAGDVSITVGRGRAKIRIEDVVISAKDGKVRIRVGGKIHTIEDAEACQLVIEKAKEIVEEQSAELIEGLGVDRARLNKRVKELLEELMGHI
ncbi:DMT family transporter [Pyrococcus yayanosii]|uniref:Uncharacterized protein n=1 Tax=Pyrococcus yayanosii (strain CH1 / JCM 16557) TaxID=529709 RepID=F8AIN3_PYRYC|nr:membrane protein [Pyrococcus yayanosii]AEH24405.1 hypothetical protein PYCH_07170 [Pyrococcus yayanosii CH1]